MEAAGRHRLRPTLGDDLDKVSENPVMALPAAPRTDIERKALVAVRWLERAFLTGDELVALLYRFFALEALLGRKSEGLKAHGLALRQMVLAHAVTGFFPHPMPPCFCKTRFALVRFMAKKCQK
jgi:hypothetical protein